MYRNRGADLCVVEAKTHDQTTSEPVLELNNIMMIMIIMNRMMSGTEDLIDAHAV